MTTEKRMLDFMGPSKIVGWISLILVLASLVSLGVRGLAFGLDFTGGSQIEILYQESTNLGEIRETLAKADLEDAVVVNFGSDREVLVRLPEGIETRVNIKRDEVGGHVVKVLQADSPTPLELRRFEFVGPQVSDDLREMSILAVFLSLFMIMMYVTARFQFKFSVGAIAALIHDVVLTLGLFSMLQLDFDLTVLAAILALIGYSINDTIVVFDRIRENFRKLRVENPSEVVNISLNETLERTLITSLTVLLVLVALFFFGGAAVHNFSIALLFGCVVGCYSSVYVASSLALLMGLTREDLLVTTQAELDDGRP